MSYEITAARGTNGDLAVHHWTPAGEPRGLLLLAHGIGEHAARYHHVAAHLNAEGFIVVAPDHQGHGLSSGTPGLIEDIEVLVDDFARVAADARTTYADVPLVILGHSMGGIVTTRALQRELVMPRAWILSAPVIAGNPAIFALLDLDPIPEVPIDPGMLSRDPTVGEAYADDALVYHGPFLRPTLVTMAAVVDRIADHSAIGDVPTLYLHGDEDPLAPYDITKSAVEGLGLLDLEQQVYRGARHEVLNETNKEDVLADVSEFLSRVVPT